MVANPKILERTGLLEQKLSSDFSGPDAPYRVVRDQYGKDKIIGNISTTLNGKTVVQDQEYFLFADNGSYTLENTQEIIDLYQRKYAKQAGGLEKLRKKFFDSGYMNDAEYRSKSSSAFFNATVDAARTHGVDLVTNYTNTGNPIIDTLENHLVSYKQQPAGPEISRQLTDPKQAVQDLNTFTQDYLSRTATPEEQKEYKKLLRAEEISTYQKRVTTKTGSGTSTDYIGDVLNQEDYMRIMGKVLKKSIAGTDVDQLLTGTGTLAQNVSAIREYASEMGIKMDGKEALNYATSNLKSGDMKNINNIDSVKLQIKEMAKYLYPSLAAGIDAGVTPGRIGREVGGYIEDELEQPAGTYGIFNSEVADFVAKGTPQSEIRAAQRKKAAFAGTDKAINEATNYLDTMLTSFGVL
jgi:hypothetical protein